MSTTFTNIIVTNTATIANANITTINSDNANLNTVLSDTIVSDNLNSGTGTLNISGTTINLGDVSSTVNIKGTLTYLDTTNTNIKDSLITLNKGGASAVGAGVEFEQSGAIISSLRLDTNRDFIIESPNDKLSLGTLSVWNEVDFNNLVVNGTLNAKGNTTIGDANTDTLTINATPTIFNTTNPKLYFSNSTLKHYISSNSNVLDIGNDTGTTGIIRFMPNNVEKVRIASNGNVGIGTTTPGYPLDINGHARVSGSNFYILGDGANLTTSTGAHMNFYNSDWYFSARGALGTNNYKFYTCIGSGDPVEKMRLQYDGKLGLGTTTPSTLLHVAGTGKFTGALDMTSQLVNNVASGVASGDAVNKGQLDTKANITYVDTQNALKYDKTGGLVSGTVSIEATNPQLQLKLPGATNTVTLGSDGGGSATLSAGGNCLINCVNSNNIQLMSGGTSKLTIGTTSLISSVPLSMTNQKIQTIANGTVSTDACAYGQLTSVDSNAVHKTGAESIAGQKTFTSTPQISFTSAQGASSHFEINNGLYFMRFFSNLSQGNYNGGVTAGDSAIIFTQNNPASNPATGCLLIGPHDSAGASGIRISPTLNTSFQPLSLNGQKIQSLAIGTSNTDAVNFGQLTTIDNSAVHKTTDETIAGIKTFSSSPIVPNATTATQAVAYGQITAIDANSVHKTGNETIAGVKTFSSSPVVPTATNSNQAVTKGQIDNLVWYGRTITGSNVLDIVTTVYYNPRFYTVFCEHAHPASGAFGLGNLAGNTWHLTSFTAYAGVTVNNIIFKMARTVAGPTALWFGIYDPNTGNKVAETATATTVALSYDDVYAHTIKYGWTPSATKRYSIIMHLTSTLPNTLFAVNQYQSLWSGGSEDVATAYGNAYYWTAPSTTPPGSALPSLSVWTRATNDMQPCYFFA